MPVSRLSGMAGIGVNAMTVFGSERSADFIRFVFSNEPASRLRGIRTRVEAALH